MSVGIMPVPTARRSRSLQRVRPGRRDTVRKALLACGAVSSVYYVLMNVYVPTRWQGYSVFSQVVSELSAIGAPTRALWGWLALVYTILLIAFGWGVWVSAKKSTALRLVGALFITNAAIGPFWPPMHLRGVEPTLSDTLHIVFTMVWLPVMLLAMVLGAVALGRRFRLYTLATLMVFVVFGALTAMDGPRIAADLPTPWIGLWERINIGAGMLWIAVLSLALLRRPAGLVARDGGSAETS